MPPPPPPPDKKRLLYEALSQKFELGDRNHFDSLMADPVKRRMVYESASQVFELGDIDHFEKIVAGGDAPAPAEEKWQPPPMPTTADVNASMGIQPPAPKERKPKDLDFTQQMKAGAKKEKDGTLTVAATDKTPKTIGNLDGEQVPIDTKPDIGVAVETLVAKFKTNSKKANEQTRKAVIDRYKSGDLVLDKNSKGESVLKFGTGFLDSFSNAVDETHKQNFRNQYVSELSTDEKIKYFKNKNVAESNEAPSGILGKTGDFIGKNAKMIADGAVGALAMTYAAPEAAAAGAATGSFGTFAALANNTFNSGYASEVEKTYFGLKKSHPDMSDREAMERAERQGMYGGVVELGTLALMTKPGMQLEPTVPVTGLLDGLVKSGEHLIKKEVPQMTGLAVASSVAKNAGEKFEGVDVGVGKAVDEAGQAAVDNASFIFALHAISFPTQIPSFLRPQAEYVAASAPREPVKLLYEKAESQGVIPPGGAEKAMEKLDEVDQAKKQFENLPIPDANKAALTGKAIQKQKLVNEQRELAKHGEAFAGRIAELEVQVKAIEADMAKLYDAKDIYKVEHDGLTGDKANDVVVKPEVVIPGSSEAADKGEAEQTTVPNGENDGTAPATNTVVPANEGTANGQGATETVPAGTTGTGQADAGTAAPVLNAEGSSKTTGNGEAGPQGKAAGTEAPAGDAKQEAPKVIKFEDAIKATHDIDMEGLPEGNDEQSREARSQMARERQQKPPTFEKHEIGTYAVDRFGDAHQLQMIPVDDLVTRNEGTQKPETVAKYAKWQRETGEVMPLQGTENFAVYGGKVVVADGNHRVLAAKENGVKELPVWVSLTDPKNPARPVLEAGIPEHARLQAEKAKAAAEPAKPEAAKEEAPKVEAEKPKADTAEAKKSRQKLDEAIAHTKAGGISDREFNSALQQAEALRQKAKKLENSRNVKDQSERYNLLDKAKAIENEAVSKVAPFEKVAETEAEAATLKSKTENETKCRSLSHEHAKKYGGEYKEVTLSGEGLIKTEGGKPLVHAIVDHGDYIFEPQTKSLIKKDVFNDAFGVMDKAEEVKQADAPKVEAEAPTVKRSSLVDGARKAIAKLQEMAKIPLKKIKDKTAYEAEKVATKQKLQENVEALKAHAKENNLPVYDNEKIKQRIDGEIEKTTAELAKERKRSKNDKTQQAKVKAIEKNLAELKTVKAMVDKHQAAPDIREAIAADTKTTATKKAAAAADGYIGKHSGEGDSGSIEFINTKEPAPKRAKGQPEPVTRFISKQGHELTFEDGKPKVIMGSGKEKGKEASRGTTKTVVEEAARAYDMTQGDEAPVGDLQFDNIQDSSRHIAETSNNPAELANVYLSEEKVSAGLSSKEQAIVNEGLGFVLEDSFNNFGDRHFKSDTIAKRYFQPKEADGRPIDVIAHEISETSGVEVTPNDVYDFMTRFPDGVAQATAKRDSPIAKVAKERFQELTGLPLTDNVAKIASEQHAVKVAEMIKESVPDDVAETIAREGITAENLEHLKDLFDGFPYDKSDYDAIKARLEGRTDNSQTTGTTGETDEASSQAFHEAEQPITNRAKAEELAKKLLSLRSDGNQLYGGITGVTVAIYDGMLSTAANIIRAGGSIMDAVDRAIDYVQTNAPTADIEKVREFMHTTFGLPYTPYARTTHPLMQGDRVLDTGRRLAELDSARDKIEQQVKQQKLKWWDKFAKRTIDGQQEILKRLNQMGQKGKAVANYLITTKGSSAKAGAIFDRAKAAIYGGLDSYKMVQVGEARIRVQALLNKVVSLKRVIDIDKKMSDKFALFTQLKTQIDRVTKQHGASVMSATKALDAQTRSNFDADRQAAKTKSAATLKVNVDAIKAKAKADYIKEKQAIKNDPALTYREKIKKTRAARLEAKRQAGIAIRKAERMGRTAINNEIAALRTKHKRLYKQGAKAISNTPLPAHVIPLMRDFEYTKEYLERNKMLINDNGTYRLGQYQHPIDFDSATAAKDLKNIEKAQPELFKELDRRSQLLSDTFHSLIDMKEGAGILTKASADALREYYYAPRADIDNFIRTETDNGSSGGQPTKDRVNINNLTGGNENLIEDSYDVQLDKAIQGTMHDIALNKVGQKLLEALQADPANPYIYENTPQIHQNGPLKGKLIRDKFGNLSFDEVPKGKSKINVWVNGKKVELIADQRLVDSYYDTYQPGEVLKTVGKWTGAKILRGAVTGYNPGFGVFQLIVDPQSAVVSSPDLYKSYFGGIASVYKDMAVVARHVFAKGEVTGIAAEARDYGAFTSFSRGEDVLNLRSNAQVAKHRAGRWTKDVLETFNWINDRAENLTRTALYKRSKELQIKEYRKKNNGLDPLDSVLEDIKNKAATDARKYVDFARGGDYAKELNSVLPYFNAAIQLKRGVIEAARKDPIRMATMTAEATAAGVGILAYSLGLGFARHGISDEERRKRIEAYQNVNEVTKSKYFLVYKGEDKAGKAQFYRFEKPMILSVAINAAENGMLKHYYPDMNTNTQSTLQNMADQLPIDRTIISRNPSLSALLKYAGNKDWYFNKEVVKNADNITDYLEGTDDPKTKEFYIWLGKKANDAGVDGGISPKRTQAAVESYTGDPTQNPISNLLTGTGAMALDAATGNKKDLKARIAALGELGTYLDFTSLPKRLIVQPSDFDIDKLEEIQKAKTGKGDAKVRGKAASIGRAE